MKNTVILKGLKMLSHFALALLLVFVARPAVATNYFVDPSSHGLSLGTYNDPWRSLDAIPETMNVFLPGDTVFFRRGQYFAGTLSINSSGANGAPIVFMPYGSGNAPVFQYNLASPLDWWNVNRMIIRINQVNHIVIDGFELIDYAIPEHDRSVTANVGHGIYIYKGHGNNGSYNTIKNCTISRLGAGITIDGGTNNTITGCVIKNMRMTINTAHINWDDHGAAGIILGGSYNTITHNRIEGCWANSYDYQYDGGAIEIYGHETSNNKILYNIAVDNLGFMEFGSGTGAQSLNNVVGYNLLINNGHICWINVGNGFGVDVRNLQILNNNIVETKPPLIADIQNLIGIFSTPHVANVITLKNNIFWLTRNVNITDPIVQPFNGPQLIHQNNLYKMQGGSLGYWLDPTERHLHGNEEVFANAYASDPETWNFNLRPFSAASDFGQYVGIYKDFYGSNVPQGNVPDAGMVETVNMILPLQVTSSKGWNSADGNTVEWVTNNDTAAHFEVEKSREGKNFQRIATVQGNTNARSSTASYQFVDKDVQDDVNYYRIKIIEADQLVHYSQIITIRRSQQTYNMTASPNPAQHELMLRIPGADFRNKEIVVYNISGVEVWRERTNTGGSQVKINVSTLARGMYVVQVTNKTTGEHYKTMFTK